MTKYRWETNLLPNGVWEVIDVKEVIGEYKTYSTVVRGVTKEQCEAIALALLAAEQRGRKAGREEAAKVAERDGSSHEDTGAYNHDQTVQIRTADRIAAAIRAKTNEVSS